LLLLLLLLVRWGPVRSPTSCCWRVISISWGAASGCAVGVLLLLLLVLQFVLLD
jgi:hypothetical protein